MTEKEKQEFELLEDIVRRLMGHKSDHRPTFDELKKKERENKKKNTNDEKEQ